MAVVACGSCTGPALTALCLTSMQPKPPDLALVEFGINANARDLPLEP